MRGKKEERMYLLAIHPLSIQGIFRILFLEVAVVQTLETFAVTSFVLSHFVNSGSEPWHG